ncbi:hypothetical protein GYMLUDRAFT_245616 [Collybiopsis luxurians FD-317 M1]|uniref:Uncharacterized protein n=1 Tax=Collybiopsis luxurians FD-317 M1 TaxID=944289 RepID=A0A0D0C9N3_9AGAR|nr:hypothetical protein GYMLUDRAFT_245616 [Collybiopsis luxurians FD-317 M1]
MDYKAAAWKKYLSFNRALIISSSYRKLWELKQNIEYSNRLIAKVQIDLVLEIARLRRRNISATSEDDG